MEFILPIGMEFILPLRVKIKAEDLAYKILQVLKITSPKNVTPVSELNL